MRGAARHLTLVRPAPPAERYPVRGTCPVCAGPIRGASEFGYDCHACGVEMHDHCYWGRVVPVEEWREHERMIFEGPEDYQSPTARCAACRAMGGPA